MGVYFADTGILVVQSLRFIQTSIDSTPWRAQGPRKITFVHPRIAALMGELVAHKSGAINSTTFVELANVCGTFPCRFADPLVRLL